jgi:3,4-dihydroxy 2-butanone 4-phosphate synthase/GTP cyclohydrolase II
MTTIQDIRRVRLAQLITERYNSQADFVSSTGENQGEVSGLLKSKSFGEKKARKIEAKAGLPAGWLDVDTQPGSAEPPAVARNEALTPPDWMAPEAFQLLTLYYAADQDGRAEIMMTALDFGAAKASVIHNKA